MNRKAFTLIELLVVVAIIGILAAVGVVAYNGYTYSAKVNVAKENFKIVVKSIQSEMMKCDLGEDQVMGFISCSLTAEQRKSALTNSANTAKVQAFFGNMTNPFRNDGVHVLWIGTSGAPGNIGISSNAVPNGVYIDSPVTWYRGNTDQELSCVRYPNDPNCWKKFIPIE